MKKWEIMENTILGLNLWAWAGFLFLVLAGVCSTVATKVSSKKIIKDEIKLGVEKITHPIQDIFNFAIYKHKEINDGFLNELSSYGTIFYAIQERKKGVNFIENGEDINVTQLEQVNEKINISITNYSNKYRISLNTLKLLAIELDNQEVNKKISVYEEFVKLSGEKRSELIQGNITHIDFDKFVSMSKITYIQLLELLTKIKKEVFENL